eukprot:CAMPEP_0184482072 /NCGR_PEP_ID=MMETSP0113_2-20130426/3644_1 /TAXON_ID=91329 /ORGANISM="Norrisiella sphaerica, Strain BC52" /LENGTH=318 /DNA_ID=CAMNT_0026861601 /DNA_START=126 /DNA_END=1082 /DNA_ORIENTATION=-
MKRGKAYLGAIFLLSLGAVLSRGFCGGPSLSRGLASRAGQTRSGRFATFAMEGQAMPSRPVAVLGANGRTGRLCVEELAKLGVPVKALTRSGQFKGAESPLVTSVKGDVTDIKALNEELSGCRAVIFAAQYNKNTGNKPSEVDYQGLVNVANVAKELDLERVVAITSGAVTRPYAPVGLLLNVIGNGVLFEKRRGEESLREILKDTGVGYTIIRPGGLKDTEAKGPLKTEFNQGDTIVGSVPRADVAAAAAAAAIAPGTLAGDATFEMYSLDPEEGVGPRPLLPWYNLPSGYESSGPTWAEAFLGLKADKRISPRGFY